jgi:hypothetical protein
MVNWLMKLIKESLTKKIHHFSLDFGSALLANIIHAQTTLTTLNQDPEYAHHVNCYVTSVDVINVALTQRKEHSGINSDALADLLVLLVKRRVLQVAKRKL